MKAITENPKTIVFHNGEIIQGKLIYKNRFSSIAKLVDSNNQTFELRSLNFLHYKFEVDSDGKRLLTMKKKWRGNYGIHTFFNSGNEEYNFRHKGFFNGRYILLDKDDRELAVLRLNFIWKSLKYEYDIAINDSFKRRPQYFLLIVIMIYLGRMISNQKRAGSL